MSPSLSKAPETRPLASLQSFPEAIQLSPSLSPTKGPQSPMPRLLSLEVSILIKIFKFTRLVSCFYVRHKDSLR